jgi:hypothetical protein
MNPIRHIRLAAALSSTHPGAPPDKWPGRLRVPLSTRDVTAADYRQIRAQFAGSRWPDLRTAGTDYVDLAVQLLTARGTDGYQTVWFLPAALHSLRPDSSAQASTIRARWASDCDAVRLRASASSASLSESVSTSGASFGLGILQAY